VVLVGLDALLPIHGMLVLLQKKPKARRLSFSEPKNIRIEKVKVLLNII
jgi:hypothetical protein